MENYTVDLMNKKDIHNYLMKEFDKFNILFKIIKELNVNSIELKIFVTELFSFYSLSNGILITYNEEDNKKFEFKQMTYPIIRRLLEKYFNILYIFDNPKEINNRCKSYLKNIEIQYNKMIKELQENNYPTNGLPSQMQKYNNETDYPNNIKSMLQTIKNDNIKPNGKNYNLEFLYPQYRILSFYAHGNIDKTILDEISPNNSNFPVIKIPEIINLIANHYNVLIEEFFPEILKKISYFTT